MLQSKIEYIGQNPVISIGGEKFPANAYITYFEERNDYKAFYDMGFRIFSVSVSLATQPINSKSGFMPFSKGIFDKKGCPDFSALDKSIELLLRNCPNALIFPRIYCAMPEWWLLENECETNFVPNNKRREALYSQKYRETAGEMLKELLEHIKNASYCDNIFGYQLSGGNTEEWFHSDLSGGYCDNALKYFNEYLISINKEAVKALPDLNGINEKLIKDEVLSDYLRFCNVSVARTIEYLCKSVKEKLGFSQIVGVFYGYFAEVSSALWGTHALGEIIESPYIDFFSSPVSYHKSRELGMDWADMLPVSSIRLHKKAVLSEADIRTHLTKAPGECRKGSDPYSYYTSEVWQGPKTSELSTYALRKAFLKQLTSGNGLWWFDMFGGWFKDEAIYNEIKLSLKLYEKRISNFANDDFCEIAVFGDETVFSQIGTSHNLYGAIYNMRFTLSRLSAPFHFYLLSDFENIKLENTKYKAFIFCSPVSSKTLENAKEKLKEKQLSFFSLDEASAIPSFSELLTFIKASGVHRFCESDDILYIGNGFVGLHASSEGQKQILLPQKMRVLDVIDNTEQETNKITFYLKQYETRIFELFNVNL